MQARFYTHPMFGTADRFASAAERTQQALNMGLPDDECPTPDALICDWHLSSRAEFGAPLAGELVEMEGKQ